MTNAATSIDVDTTSAASIELALRGMAEPTSAGSSAG